MQKLPIRIASAVALIAMSLASPLVHPVHAAVGETPGEALALPSPFENRASRSFGVIDPGMVFWYRAEYPGGGMRLGITLQVMPSDLDVVDGVNLTVNVRTREDVIGDHDADFPGFTRLGMLTETENTGVDRKFWLNFQGDSETYYLRLTNASDQPVTFAVTLDSSENVARSVTFPQDVQSLASLRSGAALAPVEVAPQTVAPPQPIAAGTTFALVGASGQFTRLSPGQSPLNAPLLTNQDLMSVGRLGPGGSMWFRVDYPGSGRSLGVTLQGPPNDPRAIDALEVFVNIPTIADQTMGEANLDWTGFSRIGQATTGDTTGSDRKFWLNFTGDPTTYFLRVNNHSARSLPFALSIQQSSTPASFGSVLTAFMASPTETPAMPPAVSPSAPVPSEEQEQLMPEEGE